MAGLLDYLFNSGTYDSGQGGLLSRLQPSLAEIPQSQGFPGQAPPLAVGNYQMPRMGDVAQFTPPPADPAALPANAQPAQGQLPTQPASPLMQPPETGGGFGGAFRGFAANAHNGPLGALMGGVAGAMGMGQGNQQRQLFQAYVGAGLTPQQAMLAVLNPQTAQTFLGGGQTDDIKEYQFAKKEDPSLTFDKFMARKKSVTGEYGLNYVYGTDKEGKTVAFAPGKSGEPKQVQFPDGITIARGIETIQTPTEVITRDKQSGVILSREKKDIAGAARQKELGEVQGQSQAKLPAAIIDAEETTKKIDDLLKNEGLDSVVGPLDQFRPSWTLGDKGRDALARLEQLQGTAFLQAFNTLKGGGAITEIEGQKAERAIARMQRSQSEADFKAALMDFRDAVTVGIRKLRVSAGETGSYPPGIAGAGSSPSQPSGGSSVDALLKKYGG